MHMFNWTLILESFFSGKQITTKVMNYPTNCVAPNVYSGLFGLTLEN